jgi:hypothetical protein
MLVLVGTPSKPLGFLRQVHSPMSALTPKADIDWCILVTRLFRQQVRERLFSRSGRPWHAFKKDG